MDATTSRLASYAAGITFEALTPAAIHECKRRIIDTLACATAAFDAEPVLRVKHLARSRSSSPSASLLGERAQTTLELAALANGAMVRFLDWNDTIMSAGSGHPSDAFGAVLAAAESRKLGGQGLIVGTVTAYEMFRAIADQVNLRERGWDQSLYLVLGAAAAAGRLLGLQPDQIGEAIAIAVTANVATRQTRAGELSMWKGLATPLAASNGMLAALLAAEGITGPTEAFEGHHGVWDQVTGPIEIGLLGGENGRPFAVEGSHLKFYPAEAHSQAPVQMAVALRERVAVENIEQLHVETYWMTYSEIGSEPAKWDPRTRETADHSLPYLLAVALQDGAITTESFRSERILDPALRPLMQRISVSENLEFTAQFPGAMTSRIEVQTRSGETLVEQASYPKGHLRNPMSDADVAAKFIGACTPKLGAKRAQDALDLLWRLEEVADLQELIQAFTVK
ncbi:MAG: MmgE/PrpD family protein [Chloroflexota bacterium]